MKLRSNFNLGSKIALIIVLGGLLLPYFAPVFAQTPPTTTPTVRITAQEWQAAQRDAATCRATGTRIGQIYNQIKASAFLAEWFDHMPANLKCRVVQNVGSAANPSYQSTGTTIGIEATFNSGGTVDKQTLETASTSEGYLSTTAAGAGKAATAVVISGISTAISTMIDWLSGGFASAAAVAIRVLGQVIKSTVQINDPSNSLRQFPIIVDVGWSVVRDVMNMFFILALIAIGIATILRIEAYNYRKLLVTLILMALLINFSKAIAGFVVSLVDSLIIILASDTMLNSFLRSFELVYSHPFEGFTTTYGSGPSSVLKLIFAIMFFFTALALSVMFIFRMVAIWFLVITSPAAYALRILPVTKKYSDMWWKKFFEYLIWAPVVVFFLRLIDLFLSSSQQAQEYAQADPIFKYGIGIVFLWIAIGVARQSGTVGATAIVGSMEKAGKWTANATGTFFARGTPFKGAGHALNKLSERTGITQLKRVGDVSTQIGKGISYGTARPQSLFNTVKERLALANRQRQKEIDEQTYDSLSSGPLSIAAEKVDKDLFAKFNKNQKLAFAKRSDISLKAANSAIEHGGRAMTEAFMQAYAEGAVQAISDPSNLHHKDAENIREAIYKSYLTARAVKEIEFEQDKDKFMALKAKTTQDSSGKVNGGVIQVPKRNVLTDFKVDEIAKMRNYEQHHVFADKEFPDIKSINIDPNVIGKHFHEDLKDIASEIKAKVVATGNVTLNNVTKPDTQKVVQFKQQHPRWTQTINPSGTITYTPPADIETDLRAATTPEQALDALRK